MRQCPEWIGATDDTPIPPRVKLRVFERFGGVCHIAKRKIRAGEPWDCDHVRAIINGGENRESNLAPALRDKHRKKTALDVAEKKIRVRKTMKHIGITKPKRKLNGRGFDTRLRKRMDGKVEVRS